jgi:CheY-like chemotaxis protein
MTSLMSRACFGSTSGGSCDRDVSPWNLLCLRRLPWQRVKAIPDPSLILILSDINMPGMTGLEMLPKVKAERPNVPVNLFSYCQRIIDFDAETPDRAFDLGMTGQ